MSSVIKCYSACFTLMSVFIFQQPLIFQISETRLFKNKVKSLIFLMVDKALERENIIAYGIMMDRILLVQYFNSLSNIKLFNILA